MLYNIYFPVLRARRRAAMCTARGPSAGRLLTARGFGRYALSRGRSTGKQNDCKTFPITRHMNFAGCVYIPHSSRYFQDTDCTVLVLPYHINKNKINHHDFGVTGDYRGRSQSCGWLIILTHISSCVILFQS